MSRQTAVLFGTMHVRLQMFRLSALPEKLCLVSLEAHAEVTCALRGSRPALKAHTGSLHDTVGPHRGFSMESGVLSEPLELHLGPLHYQ